MKYASASSTAYSLIARKGTDVTFVREGVAAFDPVTQAETTRRQSFSMKGVGIPPGRSAEFRIGSLERRNLIELHLAPRGGTLPAPGDLVRWAGANWTVIWANSLDPAADGSPYALAYAER